MGQKRIGILVLAVSMRALAIRVSCLIPSIETIREAKPEEESTAISEPGLRIEENEDWQLLCAHVKDIP